MDGVNKTLYIPLYGKAYVSKKGLFLCDKKAEEIWQEEGFALKGKSKSKWLAYYMGIRSAVFDEWVVKQVANTPDAIVIHVGCGLDSRVLRVGEIANRWYDVDFPQVIEERKHYYSETSNYKMIAGDVRENSWLANIPKAKHAVVVMEGVSMYLSCDELNSFAANLCAHFEQVDLLMDCYTTFGAKMTKIRNPINDVGVTNVYGIDNPTLLNHDNFTYIAEHQMTPQKYIDQLKGLEKFVFAKVYTGGLSQKLYRLYQFRKG